MADSDPTAIPATRSGTSWSHRADALARRVNLGWCFDHLVWALPAAAAVATAAVLFLRIEGAANLWVYLGAIIPLSVACLYSWLRARQHFIGRRQALIRLESSLHLNAALSSAADGVVDWPPVTDEPNSALNWRWERSLVPALLSILLVVVAVSWPLPVTSIAQGAPSPKPRNIAALESILGLLQRETLVEKGDLSAFANVIDKLGEGRESLYNPSTLEAADHLAKKTSEELKTLAESSASAIQALRVAVDPAGSADDRSRQAELLEAAFGLMDQTSMRPPASLREALRNAAGDGLRELDPQAVRMLEGLLGRNQELFEEMLAMLDSGQLPGSAEANRGGSRDFDAGDRTEGGSRNHGDVPPEALRFHADERGVAGERLDPLAPNPNASTPGELFELRSGRPPESGAASIVESAGLPYREGNGGGRLWKENFDPDEQRFLGEFYR